MYHLLLTRRYLTTKILPFLATIAVLLSTATVIIAWSIMTGFLGVLLDSGRTLVGDVIIAWPSAGFGHYEELIEDLESDPSVKAATPVVEVLGMIKLPDNRMQLAHVKGIEPDSFQEVTGFRKSVWWKPMDAPLPKDKLGNDIRLVSVEPLVSALGELGPALGGSLDELVDKVRDRDGAVEWIAGIESAVDEVGDLEAEGRAALKLPANSDERREATGAFLRSAERVLAEASRSLRGLVDAGIVKAEELHAAGEGDARLPGDLLLEYQDALLPVYNEYMHWHRAWENGRALSVEDRATGERVPAMLIGIEFTNFNQRFPEGYYIPKRGLAVRQPDGSLAPLDSNMLGHTLALNLLPLDSSPTEFDLVTRSIPVANEMRSGLYEFDKSWVLVDLETVQRMVRMGAAEEVAAQDPYAVVEGPDGPELAPAKVVRKVPARATHVLVRGTGTVALQELRERCERIYGAFAEKHPADVPSSNLISITTWEEDRATLVGAVKKEIVMVLLILGVVSLTVSFLILAIFWAIVREKTKDIGILRAVGASRWSVCGLWLGYALITGLLGSLLGGLAGCLIVWNINPIHDWLGRNLGLVIWDPRIYYFFEIPNKVDPGRAALVMVAGVVFAVLGALIPAVRAAFMDPVKSLRFE